MLLLLEHSPPSTSSQHLRHSNLQVRQVNFEGTAVDLDAVEAPGRVPAECSAGIASLLVGQVHSGTTCTTCCHELASSFVN